MVELLDLLKFNNNLWGMETHILIIFLQKQKAAFWADMTYSGSQGKAVELLLLNYSSLLLDFILTHHKLAADMTYPVTYLHYLSKINRSVNKKVIGF